MERTGLLPLHILRVIFQIFLERSQGLRPQRLFVKMHSFDEVLVVGCIVFSVSAFHLQVELLLGVGEKPAFGLIFGFDLAYHILQNFLITPSLMSTFLFQDRFELAAQHIMRLSQVFRCVQVLDVQGHQRDLVGLCVVSAGGQPSLAVVTVFAKCVVLLCLLSFSH